MGGSRMSSATVSQRFTRVSALQKEREAETGKQAAEAERLLKRLQETRIEAERAAREEIETTRRLQIEELQKHPQYLQWRKELREIEGKAKEWGREAERRSQQLRELIGALERQFDRKQNELARVQEGMARRSEEDARVQRQIEGLEGELAALQNELRGARLNEDDINERLGPAHAEHNRLEKELDALRTQKDAITRDWEGLHGREAMLISARDSIQRELVSLQDQFEEWQRRIAEIEEQVRKAEDLQAESQAMCYQHQGVLQHINNDREKLSGQVQQYLESRNESLQMLDQVNAEIQGAQDFVSSLEGRLGPWRSQLEDINRQIDALQTQGSQIMGHINEAEGQLYAPRMRINQLMPTQQTLQQDLEHIINQHRQAEDALTHCLAQVAQQARMAEEYERKAQEAHDEVHKAKELETQALAMYGSTDERIAAAQRSLVASQNDLAQLQNNLRMVSSPEVLEECVQEKRQECQRLENAYKRLIEEMRQARLRKEQLEHEAGQRESRLRALKSQAEQSLTTGPASFIGKLRNEIDQIDKEIGMRKSELGQTGGVNPFEERLQELRSISNDIEGRIYSSWTASTASPRLLGQLKREAEVVMRAEAALTLERQQQAVLKDASRLTRYHISTSPRFDIDERAADTLLREHTEGQEPRRIASTVIELCEQHHIHA